ncbi:hypothetical protein BBBOND_0209910 [Babesia bigemina]|uniref:Uncharacterized protein n=1 Tax=Babesia bigemina TaxID=5866 RepID=A0A061D5L8_BABBI|nr:hypothetical protein BBBOND_0209910 [Babesia bigemina]CDR95838.1 hypothetical protein BBBOND_0209910 [Babesia bigemina]|eukprot:XP_012768024.1 hypothetical protein BBBOND_0209910 [Babesia bigemina]
MAEVKNNKCECQPTVCHNYGDQPCDDPNCTKCRFGCPPGCKGCEKKCGDGKPCKCCTPRCGCENDCYEKDSKGPCKGKNGGKCKRCETKCKNSADGTCICHYCSCGTKCNGVICSCCNWCDPRNCNGGPCDGYVLGRCGAEGLKECKGHVKYDNYDAKGDYYGAVLKRETKNVITCDGNPHPGKECNGNNCNWIRGELQPDGYCVKFCTYCDKLCGQDNFRRCCTIAIPLVITVLAILIFRFMLPEKYHAITTKIRAVFPSSPRHPGRSLSNLVGDRIPEEMNVDRYPAVRPRAYAGL